jgi:hypothetical protein
LPKSCPTAFSDKGRQVSGTGSQGRFRWPGCGYGISTKKNFMTICRARKVRSSSFRSQLARIWRAVLSGREYKQVLLHVLVVASEMQERRAHAAITRLPAYPTTSLPTLLACLSRIWAMANCSLQRCAAKTVVRDEMRGNGLLGEIDSHGDQSRKHGF